MDQYFSVFETHSASKNEVISVSSNSHIKHQEKNIIKKTSQEMIASLYKDGKNLKLFIKYLQNQISLNP